MSAFINQYIKFNVVINWKLASGIHLLQDSEPTVFILLNMPHLGSVRINVKQLFKAFFAFSGLSKLIGYAPFLKFFNGISTNFGIAMACMVTKFFTIYSCTTCMMDFNKRFISRRTIVEYVAFGVIAEYLQVQCITGDIKWKANKHDLSVLFMMVDEAVKTRLVCVKLP
ncbi:hypothetical protein C9426_28530 [Serratia sp. S1B]|nr:hypothetical protein C9426_28530 [Serratia sp. S1B]